MSFLRCMAILFGLVFVAFGTIGFIPVFFENNLLLGLFQVSWVHNLFHIFTGFIALASNCSTRCARGYFRIFGLIYAAVAAIGFINAGDLWIAQMTTADSLLNTAIAAVALYLGFLTPKAADEK